MQYVNGNLIILLLDIILLKAMIDKSGLSYTPLGRENYMFLIINTFNQSLAFFSAVTEILFRYIVSQVEWVDFHIFINYVRKYSNYFK